MSTRRVGKYEILDEIGRGGFGTVYRARDTMLDRVVALKVLHPQLLVDPTFLTRFQQEARTAARLKHPHIVTIHELGEVEGVWYIAMEFLPGRPLDRIVREEGPLAPERALAVARDIGAALDHAHGLGLVHRDVKPSNIIVGEDGHATLTDFGLVRAALQSTLSTTMGLIGTPAYMSPEQCEGEELDGRSDLYALGVVLYEMLAGRVPFQADTPLPIMRGHTDKAPPLPRALNPHLAEPVEAVVLKSLAKDRAKRYASGVSLAEALEQAMQARDAETGGEVGPGPLTSSTAAQAKAEKTPARPQTDALLRKRAPGWIWLIGALLAVAAVAIVALALLSPSVSPKSYATATYTSTPIVLATPTSTATHTRTPTPSATPTATATHTHTPAPSATPTATATHTRTPTPSPIPTSTPAPTPTSPSLGDTWFRSRDAMVMVYVPLGEFQMGSSGIKSDEEPMHSVYVDGFWIDRTEVTNAQFRRCVEAGNCDPPTACYSGEPTYGDAYKAEHPVVCVSWYDATAYCDWVGGQLPTEAQWEYAARGPEARLYPWGNEFHCSKGNFDDETRLDDYVVPGGEGCDGYEQTAPVGSFPSGSSWTGALDLSGNVWEWAADWYAEDYYEHSPIENPSGPSAGVYRVVRGGAWDHDPLPVRGASRNRVLPTDAHLNVGFRCVARPMSSP